jgi:hypothetical protein
MKDQNSKLTHTMYESLAALGNVITSANSIVPGCAVVGTLLTLMVIFVSARSVPVMEAIILLVVWLSALVVYIKTRNYGEAALALVAGILTAFTVDWTPGRFAAFLIVWVVFSFLALMISSVRLAANLETIYTDAAISLSGNSLEIKALAKKLEAIGQKGTNYHQLQPEQRAEVIRLLVFRKVPVESLTEALQAIEIVTVVTRVSHQDATLFIVDVLKILQIHTPSQYQATLDQVMSIIRGSAVSPIEFIKAFQESRSLVLSGRVSAENYFRMVKEALENGVAPDDVAGVISEQFRVR